MNIAENCLRCLQEKNWLKLNSILSNEQNCTELFNDPIFLIFEKNLVSEIERFENDNQENLSAVLARILILNQDLKILNLSKFCVTQIAEYLFSKYPSEKYAKILSENNEAKEFLKQKSDERRHEIDKTIIAANLDIKIGTSGTLDFSKSIFNSPQEKELFFSAKLFLKDEILLPNISLSSIINSKITELLDIKTKTFFYQSTLDLCIVDSKTLKPIFFIELDSTWHDHPNQVLKDKMKDEIFHKAGFKLFRIRKKENKPMQEIFELFLKKNYNL